MSINLGKASNSVFKHRENSMKNETSNVQTKLPRIYSARDLSKTKRSPKRGKISHDRKDYGKLAALKGSLNIIYETKQVEEEYRNSIANNSKQSIPIMPTFRNLKTQRNFFENTSGFNTERNSRPKNLILNKIGRTLEEKKNQHEKNNKELQNPSRQYVVPKLHIQPVSFPSYHEEFMAKIQEFSNSWRDAIRKGK